MDVAPLRVGLRVKVHASGVQRHVFGHQIGLGVHGVGEPAGAGGVLHQPRRPPVVGVVDAHVALAHQQRLGVAVFLHGLVKVQMILTEVGEDAHGEPDAVHPIQHQCVGGYLHHHMGAARVGHLPQQPLQLEGLRRGALRVERPVADHILDGADQPHLGPGLLLQNALDEVGAGGLAAGAGDADHGQLPGGMVKAVAAHHRQRPAGVGHLHEGDVPLRYLFAQHAGGALLPRHGDKSVAVRRRAGYGDEQVARLHQPGVVLHLVYVCIQVGAGGQNVQPGQQLLQCHGGCTPLQSISAIYCTTEKPRRKGNRVPFVEQNVWFVSRSQMYRPAAR